MKTIISIQQRYIDRILTGTPYSDRTIDRPYTFLRRKQALLRSARHELYKACASLGITEQETDIIYKDARDMAELEYNAE